MQLWHLFEPSVKLYPGKQSPQTTPLLHACKINFQWLCSEYAVEPPSNYHTGDRYRYLVLCKKVVLIVEVVPEFYCNGLPQIHIQNIAYNYLSHVCVCVLHYVQWTHLEMSLTVLGYVEASHKEVTASTIEPVRKVSCMCPRPCRNCRTSFQWLYCITSL